MFALLRVSDFLVYPSSSDRSLCQLTRSTLTNITFMFVKIWPTVGHRVGHGVHGLGHGLPHVLSTPRVSPTNPKYCWIRRM